VPERSQLLEDLAPPRLKLEERPRLAMYRAPGLPSPPAPLPRTAYPQRQSTATFQEPEYLGPSEYSMDVSATDFLIGSVASVPRQSPALYPREDRAAPRLFRGAPLRMDALSGSRMDALSGSRLTVDPLTRTCPASRRPVQTNARLGMRVPTIRQAYPAPERYVSQALPLNFTRGPPGIPEGTPLRRTVRFC